MHAPVIFMLYKINLLQLNAALELKKWHIKKDFYTISVRIGDQIHCNESKVRIL